VKDGESLQQTCSLSFSRKTASFFARLLLSLHFPPLPFLHFLRLHSFCFHLRPLLPRLHRGDSTSLKPVGGVRHFCGGEEEDNDNDDSGDAVEVLVEVNQGVEAVGESRSSVRREAF